MTPHPPSADRPTGPDGSGHPEIDELAAYAAGDLDVAGGDPVRAHLADCADCSADVAAIELASADLGALSVPAMPGDVATRLTAALDAARSAPAAGAAATVLPAQRSRRSSGWGTGAAAAVVVALVAAVGINALGNSSNNDEKATSASSASRDATLAVYQSGTNYTDKGIRGQVQTLLSQPAPGRQTLESGRALAVSSSAAAATAANESAPEFSAASSAAASSAAPALAAPAATSSAASAESFGSAAAAPPAPAAAPAPSGAASDAAAAKSADPFGGSAATPVPPADLSALRGDPARLAACIQSLTDGEVQPIAIDYATYEDEDTPRQPALAIVLPTADPKVNYVYVVDGNCGTPAGEGVFLHLATLPAR